MLFPNPLQRLMPNGYRIPDNVPQQQQQQASPLVDTPPQSPLNAMAQPQPDHPYATPLLDKYSALMQNPPTRDQFAPSTSQRILGSLAGMGAGASPVGITNGAVVGFKYDPKASELASSAITDKPYNEAVGSYDMQADALSKGAAIEEKDINNKRGVAALQQQADIKDREDKIKQQQADVARKKEQDIYDTKQAELQAKLDKAANDLSMKQKELDSKNANAGDLIELHKRQMDVQAATHQLEIAQRDRVLDESKRAHDILQQRADLYAQRLKQLGQPTDEKLYDADGKLLQEKVIGKSDNAGPLPPANRRIPGVTEADIPNIGHAVWSANGWVPKAAK